MRQTIAALTILFIVTVAHAQPDPALAAIQDNSFLLEEAYNQESGVVQHIGVIVRDSESDEWTFAFTQEWPFHSQRHQLSYTIPFSPAGSGVGDVFLNYRYQLRGTGDSILAIAPRLSLILSSDDEGGSGVQVNLPISRVVAKRVISHTNLGGTSGD